MSIIRTDDPNKNVPAKDRVVSVTTTYTVVNPGRTFICTDGTYTITVPSPTDFVGEILTFLCPVGSDGTANMSGTITISLAAGCAAVTTATMSTSTRKKAFYSDGFNWYSIG